jgi:hypothetical protein
MTPKNGILSTINEIFYENSMPAFTMAILCKIAHPSGLERKAEASLEGVQAAKGERLELDSEGWPCAIIAG